MSDGCTDFLLPPVRVFVRVFTSPLEAKKSPSKLAYVWKCVGCESTTLQRVGRIVQKGNSTKHVPGTGPAVGAACEHCGGRFTMGGPIWAEPIHDPEWTKGILAEAVKIRDRYPAFNKLHPPPDGGGRGAAAGGVAAQRRALLCAPLQRGQTPRQLTGPPSARTRPPAGGRRCP